MDSAKFDQQDLYRLSDLAAVFTDGNLAKARLHLEKKYLPCSHPTTAPGVTSMFSQGDLLTCGVFYQLIGDGIMHQAHAARIARMVNPLCWQDVRDGFTSFMIVSLTGEGGAIFAFDLDDLPEPNTPVSLVIDLAAIRRQVIQKVNDTFEARTKAAGLD